VVSYSQCNVLTGHHCVLEIIWSVISWYLSCTIRLSFHFQNVTYESLDDMYCSKFSTGCNPHVLGWRLQPCVWYLSYHLSFQKNMGVLNLFLCVYIYSFLVWSWKLLVSFEIFLFCKKQVGKAFNLMNIFNHNITRPVFAVKHVHLKYWPSQFKKHDKIVISLSKRHLWIRFFYFARSKSEKLLRYRMISFVKILHYENRSQKWNVCIRTFITYVYRV
jgi:hypothetical protein